MIKYILLLILVLACGVLAQPPGPDLKITRFDLNPTYGYATRAGDTSDSKTNYLLLVFSSSATNSSGYSIVDSVLATGRPQLCDSNAISLGLKHRSDSGMLIVVDYDRTTEHDTVITFPIEDLRGSYSSGQQRLYNVSKYVLFRQASLLFWQVPYPRRPIIEAGKIREDGTYETLDVCVECGFPRMTFDFSMVLYTVSISHSLFDPWKAHTLINAYDCSRDSSYLFRRVVGHCHAPQLLHQDDDLFCIWSENMDINHFSVVTDSIPIPLFTIEYPVSIAGYRIFEDSIVVRTTNCCDKDYGIQTHIILR